MNSHELYAPKTAIFPGSDLEVVKQRIELGQQLPGEVDVVIAKNQEVLGQYVAHQLATVSNFARTFGYRVGCDMPTGSSPESTWKALAQLVQDKKVNLSNIIWSGHEAEWPPQPNTPLDYEQQRINILRGLGVTITPINIHDVFEEKFDKGNFIPMHLVEPHDKNDRTQVFQAARQSAILQDLILFTLYSQKNIIRIGMHGVGPDGHGWGELQLSHMWPERWSMTDNTFVEDSDGYTPSGGLWRLSNSDGFYEGHNFVGNVYPEINLMGLGRTHMQKLDYALEIFNSAAKAPAFQKTLKALRGEEPGEGEILFVDFINYGSKLGIDCTTAKTCYQVFQKIAASFDQQTPESVYGPLWLLAARYFGSQLPVSKVVLERAAMGKPTTLITTSEVAQGLNIPLV